MKESVSVLPFSGKKHNHSQKGPKIWGVCSGKGGVGKSFITSSLGVTLTKQGLKVTLVDLDLSGANLHSWFGISPFNSGVAEYFNGNKPKLNELETASGVHNLKVVVGFNQSWSKPELSDQSLHDFVNDLKKLNSDVVIVDMGAGSSKENLALLELLDEKILVTSPEPQSIESHYRLLESYMMYSLKQKLSEDKFNQLIYDLKAFRQNNLGKPFSFRNFLAENEIFQSWEDLKPKKPMRLIINQVRSFDDENLGPSIKSVVNKYFDSELDYLGYFQFDNAVWQCARKKSAVLIEQPFNPLVGQFLAMTKQLVDPVLLKAVV